MKKLLTAILAFSLFTSSYGQANKSPYGREGKALCLLTGVGYSQYVFADLGISINQYSNTGIHPFAFAYFVSTEVHVTDRPFIGPKVGVWFALFPMLFGLDAVYYTGFDQHSLVLKPEIGIGFDRFKISYAYNAKITNKYFDKISSNAFSLTYCFKVKRLKIKNSQQ